MTESMEMPKYQCHKVVHALRIKRVETQIGGSVLHFVEDGYAPMPVPVAWAVKHQPHGTGYYVVDEDGFRSFSNAASFESGHAKIE